MEAPASNLETAASRLSRPNLGNHRSPPTKRLHPAPPTTNTNKQPPALSQPSTATTATNQYHLLWRNHLLSVEDWSLAKCMQKGSPTNHGKTTSKCNTRTSNVKEPVRKHEEYPVYEIPNSSADLAKGGELSRHTFVAA